MEERVDGPIRAMDASVSQDMLSGGPALRPGGAAPSFNRSGSDVSLRPQAGFRGPARPEPRGFGGNFKRPEMARQPLAQPPPPAASPQTVSPKRSQPAENGTEKQSVEPLSEKEIQRKTVALAAEYYSSNDLQEAATCVSELSAGKADMAVVLKELIMDGLEAKGRQWETVMDFIFKLAEKCHCISKRDLKNALEQVLSSLPMWYADVPKAPSSISKLAAKIVAYGAISLTDLLQHICTAKPEMADGEEEDEEEMDSLVEAGLAPEIVAVVMKALKESHGLGMVLSGWFRSGKSIKDLLPSYDEDMERAVKDHGLEFLDQLQPVRANLRDAIAGKKDADEILAWMNNNVDQGIQECAALTSVVSEEVCRGAMPSGSPLSPADSVIPVLERYSCLLHRYTKTSELHQLACIRAMEKVFFERGHPKGLMACVLEEMHRKDVLPLDVLTKWQDARDDSQEHVKAITDATKLLDELRQK
uniref:Arm repeat-containing protein n=1 Tax=Tetraselmis sp. GSL018 TaxID=582737 RepID=A0A061R1E3_9CHLO